jgi:threonine dehydratase
VGEALAHLEVLRAERGLTLVHPYDDPEVLIGNGSCGLEILEDLPDVDVVVAGIGGGGLIGGVATAIGELRPSVRIYGVEPVGSEAMTRGLEAGEPVRVLPASVADGLGAPSAGRHALRAVQRYVADVVLIDDPTILAGLRFGVERLKQVLEPAGSAALAAVLTGAVPLRPGDRVCVILSGGNVAVERLGELLAAAAPLQAAG